MKPKQGSGSISFLYWMLVPFCAQVYSKYIVPDKGTTLEVFAKNFPKIYGEDCDFNGEIWVTT